MKRSSLGLETDEDAAELAAQQKMLARVQLIGVFVAFAGIVTALRIGRRGYQSVFDSALILQVRTYGE